METEDVDVVVVGLGPGGEHAAIRLGRAGFDVVAVENRLVGGECPYYGCVPTKMMIAAARVVADARRVPGGGTSHIRPDWSRVARRVREEATDDWDDKVAVERLTDSSVTFVRDTARLAGPGRVEVGGTTYVASRGVVLNTGTAPAAPSIDGLEDTPYWTNREAVSLTELPNSIVVLGGGAIGCEFAQIFRRFGVAVTVVEAAERLLALEEPEASALLQKAFVAEGIEVFTGAKIAAVRHRDDMFSLNLGDRQVTADKLLVAAGRRPNLAGIGLETVGLDPEAAAVETDERLRAGEKLWAVGDITGKGAYTHVSMYQAAVVVHDIMGQDGPAADYRAVSRVAFTDPEVASVGMSKKQAREAGLNPVTAVGDLGARGWIAQEEGLIKVVADPERDVLVGACVVGSTAGEILSMLATAVQAQVPLATLRSMHYAYPTYHRAVASVLEDLDAD